MPHHAVSDLFLHSLPMSHKKDSRVIWGKIKCKHAHTDTKNNNTPDLPYCALVKINNTFKRKIVNIFYPSVLTFFFDAQKNRLIKMVLLSTHNICFG